jgi:exopolysaccharide biosynthesis polyprenyl glycosylphosphotransferase
MLHRQRHFYTQVRKLMDAGLFSLAFWLAHLLRSHYWKFEIFGGTRDIQPFDQYVWIFLVVFPLGPFLLEWQGYYTRSVLASRRVASWQVLYASLIASFVVISVMFLMRTTPSRSLPFFFGGISFFLIMGKDQLVRLWFQSRWGQVQLNRRFVLVGAASDNQHLRAELKAKPLEGVEIFAQLDLNGTPIEKLADLLHEHSANGVILNAKHAFFGQIERAIQICELEGVEAWLLADFFKTQISKTMLDDLLDRPMLVFRSTPEESWQGFAKQITDVVVSFFLLLFLSPLFLLVALLIKRTSAGPVFFRQQRSGLNGKPFTMLKFRSMVSDAEQRKHEFDVLNEMDGPVFKITDDPRITPIGRSLRRFSIDELPQLWNVLRGEMSLVGPRPLPVDEVRRFDDLAHRRRLSVKPGLTCLWQVSGRNQITDFKDWVRLDLEYIDNWSLWLDLKILVRTIPVILLGTGAK